MRYENFSVEAYKLEVGVNKLLKYGMDTFEIYADEVGMSFCDRNRVIGKCNLAYGKKLKEMPCPKQLIGERWNFYTKRLGYTNEKAREIIARIDTGGGTNGSIGDAAGLTKGIG